MHKKIKAVIGNIFVNDNTSYTDIEVSEHLKKYLTLIKESMLRKKKAYEIYQKEIANIQALTTDLLKESNALSNEDFEKELTSRLSEKSISFSFVNKSHGKTSLVYRVNSDIELTVTTKKHFISDIRINTCKDTKKIINDLDFAISDIFKWVKIINEDKYNEFIKNYIVTDLANTNLGNLINSNDLTISSSNQLLIDKETDTVIFKSLDIIQTKDKEDIILLNNDTIDIILNLLDLIKKN